MFSTELITTSEEILSQGRERLQMDIGIVSRIENDQYTIVSISGRQSDV